MRRTISYYDVFLAVKRKMLKEAEDSCTAEGGKWVTMQGTHVCIRKGESPEAALKRTIGKDVSGDSSKTQKDINTPKTDNKTGKDKMDDIRTKIQDDMKKQLSENPDASQINKKRSINRAASEERAKIVQDYNTKIMATDNSEQKGQLLQQRNAELKTFDDNVQKIAQAEYQKITTKTNINMKTTKVSPKKSPDYSALSPEHQKLADQLPEIEIDTDNNDQLAQKLIDRAEGIKPVSRRSTIDGTTYYNREDPEFDGIDIGQNATKKDLYAEAEKHCSHPNLKNDLYASYTADARKYVQQTCSCARCQLYRSQKAEEDVRSW